MNISMIHYGKCELHQHWVFFSMEFLDFLMQRWCRTQSISFGISDTELSVLFYL